MWFKIVASFKHLKNDKYDTTKMHSQQYKLVGHYFIILEYSSLSILKELNALKNNVTEYLPYNRVLK